MTALFREYNSENEKINKKITMHQGKKNDMSAKENRLLEKGKRRK